VVRQKIPSVLLIFGLFISLLVSGFLSGCATIKLGPSYDQPIIEQVLEEGKGQNKVLVIQLTGILSDSPKVGLLSKGPSVLDALMMQLNKAEKDDAIKTILLKINSPGGGVTVSDIMFHELQAFKERTKKKLYVQMMDVAASGGVYIAMAADHIQAHPTTITGSVGVISVTADLSGSLDKLGAKVNVYKTGDNKDMGSPFREASASDKQAFQTMVDAMAMRFYDVVKTNRNLSSEKMNLLETAKIFSGEEALTIGLVDSLGYVSDATDQACQLAGSKKCSVVSYRFAKNVNATTYSPSMQMPASDHGIQLLDLPILDKLKLEPGMYYLYLQ